MEKTEKIVKENVSQVISQLEWKPRGSELIISTNLVDVEGGDLDLSGGMISEVQVVISVGEHIRDIKEGDVVFLDMLKLMKQSANSRDFDNPVVELDIFPLPAGEHKLGIINAGAVKLIKK